MKEKLILGIILILLFQNLFAKEEVIAKIDEASGICYSKKSNTLFVVGDEGYIYELSLNGKILKQQYYKNYDFEGITIDEENSLLLVAVEGEDEIFIYSKKSLKYKSKISIKREYKKVKVLKKGGDGLEGITLYKNKIYISNQSNKKYPKKDSSFIAIIDYDLAKKKQKIKEIIDPKYKDIAGLSFHNDILYFVSDKKSLLVKYNLKKQKVLKEFKLNPKHSQEGITFDKDGNLYIADDNGQILKIKDFVK